MGRSPIPPAPQTCNSQACRPAQTPPTTILRPIQQACSTASRGTRNATTAPLRSASLCSCTPQSTNHANPTRAAPSNLPRRPPAHPTSPKPPNLGLSSPRNRRTGRHTAPPPPQAAPPPPPAPQNTPPAIAQRIPPSTHPPEPPSHLRPRLHQGSTRAPPRLPHQPEPPTRRLRRLRHPRPRATLSAHTRRSEPRAATRSSTRTTPPRQPRSQRNLPNPISVKPLRGVPGTRTSGRCARKRRFSTGKVLP